ncbi:MAG: LLM class flavin-dependent oxidoreductase [Pseudomonadota bacterium]
MALGLGLGTSRFPFDSAGGYWRWVELCEAGGVDSIWQTDRLVSREPMLECIATMAALAGATSRIRFGMNVASVALRDPLLTAKQLATIDMLSDGRLLPAFGIGSALSQDYVATGTPTRRRGKKADEALELIARLWREESVSFNGEFFQYQNAVISPRPVNPHIPLWIGGSSEVAMMRTARLGTGWLGGIDSPEQTAVMVAGIKAACRETGRMIDEDHYGATFSFRFGSRDEPMVARAAAGLAERTGKDPFRFMVAGDAADIINRVNEYIEAGCSKFVMLPIASGDDDMMVQTQRFIEEVQPVFLHR